MKNIVKILISLFACVALLSCDNDEQKQYEGSNDGYLPITDMAIHPLGDEVNVSFISESAWKIEGVKEWMSVKVNGTSNNKGSSGTSNLIFTINPFYADKDEPERKSVVTFRNSSTNEVIDSFTITQKPAYVDVSITNPTNDAILFSWHNAEKPENVNGFTVDSSVECKITYTNIEVINVDREDSYFGKASEANSTPFVVKPSDYNFNIQSNECTITIEPIKRNANGVEVSLSSDIIDNLKKSISVSQDFLIFTVLEGSIDDMEERIDNGEIIEKTLDLTDFSELGYNYLDANDLDTDDATKTIVIAAEDNAEYGDFPTDSRYEFHKVPGNVTKSMSGRNVTLTQYEVRVLKPNALKTQYEIPVELPLEGYDDITEAVLSFNLVQKPYVFDIKRDGNDVGASNGYHYTFDNHGDESVTYTLNTTGPWTLTDYAKEWLSSEEITFEDGKDSGAGVFEFTLTAENQNLSFEDVDASLLFTSGNFGGDLETPHTASLNVKQAAFEFAINTLGKDGNETPNLLLTSSNTKSHTYDIKCSGPWTFEVLDNSENWLSVETDSGEYEGDGNGNLTVQASANEDDDARSVRIKLISTLHRDADYTEEEYSRIATITQDQLFCELLNAEGGEAYTGWSDIPAYIQGGSKSTFYVKCSTPWKIESYPNWMTLQSSTNGVTIGSNSISGDGSEYATINVTISNNPNKEVRNETICIKADIDGDGNYDGVKDRELPFTISQDELVFELVPADATTSYSYAPINEESAKSIAVKATKDLVLDVNNSANWTGWVYDSESYPDSKTKLVTYKLDPEHNLDINTEPRNAIISIANTFTPEAYKINVTQEAFKFTVNKRSLDNFDEVNASVQRITVEECTGNYYDVKIENGNWMKDPEQIGSQWKFVPASDNISATPRTADIKFVVNHPAANGIELLSIPVKQNAYVWEVSSPTKTAVPTLGDDVTISVKSSGSWKVEVPSGVTATPSTGSGGIGGNTTSVKLTFKPNYDETAKSNIQVKVVCNDNSDWQKTMTFTQEAYEFVVKDGNNVVGSSGYEKNIVCEGETFEINVECSDPTKWDVEYDKSATWIEAKKSGNNKLVVTVDPNKGSKDTDATEERRVKIKVKTTDNSKLTREINVIQEGYTPSAS